MPGIYKHNVRYIQTSQHKKKTYINKTRKKMAITWISNRHDSKLLYGGVLSKVISLNIGGLNANICLLSTNSSSVTTVHLAFRVVKS